MFCFVFLWSSIIVLQNHVKGVDGSEGDAGKPTSTEGSQTSFAGLYTSLLLALEKP